MLPLPKDDETCEHAGEDRVSSTKKAAVSSDHDLRDESRYESEPGTNSPPRDAPAVRLRMIQSTLDPRFMIYCLEEGASLGYFESEFWSDHGYHGDLLYKMVMALLRYEEEDKYHARIAKSMHLLLETWFPKAAQNELPCFLAVQFTRAFFDIMVAKSYQEQDRARNIETFEMLCNWISPRVLRAGLLRVMPDVLDLLVAWKKDGYEHLVTLAATPLKLYPSCDFYMQEVAYVLLCSGKLCNDDFAHSWQTLAKDVLEWPDWTHTAEAINAHMKLSELPTKAIISASFRVTTADKLACISEEDANSEHVDAMIVYQYLGKDFEKEKHQAWIQEHCYGGDAPNRSGKWLSDLYVFKYPCQHCYSR